MRVLGPDIVGLGLHTSGRGCTTTCESCQVHSEIRHYDELRPNYPPTIHFNWMVDLVMMLMRVGQMRYLILVREDLRNQVEGQALKNKTTTTVCQFLIKDVT